MTHQFNLSLSQHALPGRNVPTTSGGFLGYPSKIRSLRNPTVDIAKTTNGPNTKLILNLGLPRGQSPGEGRRVRESLEEMSDVRAMASSVIFDPTSSQVVQHFRNKATIRGQVSSPSLIGGSGFADSLNKRNLDSLRYARMKRSDVDVQTAPAFTKLDLSDLSEYQKWNKGKCDPFLKELRQAILSNRPEDIGEFVIAWTLSYVNGSEPPQAWLPGEDEARQQQLRAETQKEESTPEEAEAAP